MVVVMKTKTRPAPGPTYKCGHRAYVISPIMVAAMATVPCYHCREEQPRKGK